MDLLCRCEKWLVEVEPEVFAHQDDDAECTPNEPLPVTYIDETVEVA